MRAALTPVQAVLIECMASVCSVVSSGRWALRGRASACVAAEPGDPGGGRDVQRKRQECVLSFYFTNNNPEEKKGINKRATFQEQSKPFLRGSAA